MSGPCVDLEVRVDAAGFVLRLQFGWGGAPPAELVLTFAPDVLAYTSYDEYAHPWNRAPGAPVPRLPAPWAQYAYPLLVVADSPWASDTVARAAQPPEWLTHYRVVSLGHTLDVLTSGQVRAAWSPVAA